MDHKSEEQINMFDFYSGEEEKAIGIDIPDSLKVVRASFEESVSTDWTQLFDGFDYLFAITFSSGIDFVNKVVSKFKHSVIVFGCEGVMNNDTAAVIAMQAKVVQNYVKRKSAKAMAEKIDDGSLELFHS